MTHGGVTNIGGTDNARRQPISRRNMELVRHEIEIHLEGPLAVWHRPGCQAPWGEVQRRVPPVVDVRTERQPDFPHDLGPAMHGHIGLLPRFQGKRGPSLEIT